ncbi:hypothetical protein ACFE04_018378 [Oxalis oulophora]
MNLKIRGRSIAPKSDDTRNSTAGRSLSRSTTTDTTSGRGRSVSRGSVSRRQFVYSESEVEQEDVAARFWNATSTTLSAVATSTTNLKRALTSRTTTSDHQSLAIRRSSPSIATASGSSAFVGAKKVNNAIILTRGHIDEEKIKNVKGVRGGMDQIKRELATLQARLTLYFELLKRVDAFPKK